MFYVVRLPSGIARVSMVKPKKEYPYITIDTLPSGSGMLKFNALNELVKEPALPQPTSPLDDIQQENTLLKAQVRALSDRSLFLEECLIEMSYEVYM